jgi:imidazolonepropionase-like amidohydrolase
VWHASTEFAAVNEACVFERSDNHLRFAAIEGGSVGVNLGSTRHVLAISLLTAFCGLQNVASGADAATTVISDVTVISAAYDRLGGSGDAVTRYLAENNARLLFGTDTPAAPIYTNPPGLNGFYEMRRWIAAGVTTPRLFRAATIENARVMRLDRDIGTIEKGKRAHLLLLRANPLESVEAYNTIDAVFLGGRLIRRETLSAH